MMLAQELSTTAVATNPAFRNRRAISAGKLNLMLFPWCQVNWNASNDAPLFLVSGWASLRGSWSFRNSRSPRFCNMSPSVRASMSTRMSTYPRCALQILHEPGSAKAVRTRPSCVKGL